MGTKALKAFIKNILPKPLLNRYLLLRDARRLREQYFGRQLRVMRPLMIATGETHNFTYDLREENLCYLAEMVAVATGKTADEIAGYFNRAMRSPTAIGTPAGIRIPFL